MELVEREVRVRVEACGVCHSDAFTVEGLMPGIEYPRVPGHEIAGSIDAVGDDVAPWEIGQRVDVGWFGHHYIDSNTVEVAAALQELGGASTILATVTASDAMSAAVGGLAPRGRMVVVGASGDPMQFSPIALLSGSTGVVGHASGTSKDSEDTMRFSALQDVRPSIETYPLEEAAAGYARMMSGDARFRVVLTTGA